MEFTNPQIKAYKAINNNFLISAGAGSGKTQVLSERVRYLVEEEGYHIDDFLILTFTELAAGEMKDRIRKKLEKVAPLEASKVDNAFICTFDSYAFSIVKKYHYVLGLSKNISILDENIVRINIKQLIRDKLDQLYLEKDPIISRFVNKFCFKDDDELGELIFNVFEKAKKAIDEEEYLNQLIEKTSNRIVFDALSSFEKKLDKLIEELLFVLNDVGDEKYINKTNLALQGYFNASTLDEKAVALKDAKYPSKNKNCNSEVVEIIKEIRAKIKDILTPFRSTKSLLEEFESNKVYTYFIVSFVRELLEFDKKYKFEHQSFSFGDIAKMAISIFKDNESIRESIKKSLKFIMIDEYQDTSLIQEIFISYISSNNVYMVGDVKQSIYRFRDATPELFIDKFAKYQDANYINGELINLQDNFRSREEVLDDINLIFSRIMTLDCGGADYKKDHIIGKGNKTYALAGDTKHSNSLCILQYNSENINDKDEYEARLIAQDIIKKIKSQYLVFDGNFNNPGLRPCRLDDFCILIDRGTSFFVYEKIFREYQIPLFVENNVDISRNEVVLAISSLLNLIKCIRNEDYDSPTFRHAYLSFSRSFIIGRKDGDLYSDIKGNIFESPVIIDIKNWLIKNAHLTTYELILDAIKHFEIYAKLVHIGDVKVYEKYLDNFIVTLNNLYQLNFTFDEYVDYFEKVKKLQLKIEVSSSTTSFEAVKIMNIFKSKGLEFPLVYCSGLAKEFNKKEYCGNFFVSNVYGIIYPRDDLEKSIIFYENKDEQWKESLSEKIRILYVALTRAKERIFMVMPYVEKIKPLAEATSMLDLFLQVRDKFEITNVELENEKITYNRPYVEKRPLLVDEINIEPIKKEKVSHASKDLSLDVNVEALDRGEELHALMELTDFMNPDYTSLDYQERKTLEQFLKSPLMEGWINPVFYKEYEFVDDINNSRGIIDCLIVENDRAVIIDYKLKNIDDEHYHQQLQVYYNFVNTYFGIVPECYLYSLMTGNYEKIILK